MKHNQNGSINVLLIPLIVAVLILVGAVGFGSWAYSSRQNFKNNTDQQVAAAVSAAKQQTTTELDNQFTVQQESPYNTYTGPEAYGSLILKYPKTWSAYVDDTGGSGANINGYFYPGVIPSLSSTTSVFSLRVEVIGTPYSQSLQPYTGGVTTGADTVSPYELPLLPNVVGAEITGKLSGGQSGTMVILPIRSQTLEVWTESTQYLNVFNQVILPNLTFSP